MKKGQEFFKYVWKKGVNGIMQVFQTQETLSPEVSVCFDMLLIGVNDVSSMFVQIKEAIAKALKTEKAKVNLEKISSSQNMCKIRVGVHTRNIKEIQKIMNQRSGFVQDFKKSVDYEGLQLTDECIGDLKVNNTVESVEFTDQDGDDIKLVWNAKLKQVQEYVNGKLEVHNVRYFHVNPATLQYKDVGGFGKLRNREQIKMLESLR
eukprot:UN25299